ncbi:MAG: hypothetical protein K6A74_02160 [Lachnospiraceae bacterium]|nr:hypothetical protein [Lachnospiraceae bacterium]
MAAAVKRSFQIKETHKKTASRKSSAQTARMQDDDVIHVFVEGNTVRQAVAENAVQPKAISQGTLANRERAAQMNIGYVMFLTLAAVLTVMICVNYLRLQARYTSLQKTTTALELRLGSLKLENDAEYNRIISGVNLEDVKAYAMDRLGMVYATEDQIVTYEAAEKDYVKQYRDIP